MSVMNATALRELQAPLKQRYREDPSSARTPVAAYGTFDSPGITCVVGTWPGITRAGLHPATGGDGTDACSADMLLQALLACVGVTMRSVATAMNIDIVSAELSADGMFDVQGTLGVSRDVPVGVRDIHVAAVLQTDADDATLTKLAEVTERYCVVAQSLGQRPTITIERAA
jgi:uncharacterized OsmC-like protein